MGLLIIVEDVFEFGDGTIHFAPAVPFEVIDRERLKQGDQPNCGDPTGRLSELRFTTLIFSGLAMENLAFV